MKKTHGKVLVLGEDTRSFLTVVRSLGRAGIDVHIGWCPRKSSESFSRYIKKFHDLPHPVNANNDWKICLKNLLIKERFNLVIPCNDPSIIPLQLNRKYFEDTVKIYLLNDYAYEITSDKYKSYKLAKNLDIPVPKQIKLDPPYNIKQILETFDFPVVLKSLYSFNVEDLANRKEVHKVFSQEELVNRLSYTYEGTVLVQENFRGIGTDVIALVKNGKVLVAFQVVYIHEPLLGGMSSYRKSVSLSPDLLNAACRFLKVLHYTGVADLEFRLNPVTGDWVFLEINGRFWGSLPLSVYSGINFPLYLYQLIQEGKTIFATDYKTDIYCRNLVDDIEWIRKNFVANKSNPHLNIRQLVNFVVELFKNLFALRERSDTFVIDDLKPALADLLFWWKNKWNSIKVKIRVRLYSVRLFRNIAKSRIFFLIKINRRILFISYGNIIRSSFAEAYAKSVFPHFVKVFSRGFYSGKCRSSPEAAVELVKQLGIDLSRHSSSILSYMDIRDSGVIFVFDRKDYKFVIENYPWAKKKVFFIGIFDEEDSIIISDPYGEGKNILSKAFQKIFHSLNNLNKDLQKLNF